MSGNSVNVYRNGVLIGLAALIGTTAAPNPETASVSALILSNSAYIICLILFIRLCIKALKKEVEYDV